MVSFDDLKVSLSTYIMRNKRVTYQDLLKWSSSNKVGNTLLYLIIKELIRERRFKASGEYVIGSIRVGNGEVKLSIPTYIEVPGEVARSPMHAKRQVRQRHVRSSSILEVFSEGKKGEAGQATTEGGEGEKEGTSTSAQGVDQGSKQRPGTVGMVREETHESGKAELEVRQGLTSTASAEGAGARMDYSTVAMDEFTAILRRAINEELMQNREEGYKVAIAMLSYLQKYWSVGELRLKLDIAKQFGGVNEGIMRIEDGVLRALRKLGIVEVVEPGVVNRIKELPRDFIKVRLDSLFT